MAIGCYNKSDDSLCKKIYELGKEMQSKRYNDYNDILSLMHWEETEKKHYVPKETIYNQFRERNIANNKVTLFLAFHMARNGIVGVVRPAYRSSGCGGTLRSIILEVTELAKRKGKGEKADYFWKHETHPININNWELWQKYKWIFDVKQKT